MRVFVVCQYFHPEPFRITEICEELAVRGHSVHVLTGRPNYPTGKIPKEYRAGRRRHEIVNGVEVTRIREIPRKTGTFGLLLNYASFALLASIRALRVREAIDVIFVYQLSPVTMALPALVLKKCLRRPVLLYCLDLWPESMKILRPGERGSFFRVARWLSGVIYRGCDAVTVSSPSFVDYLAEVHALDPSLLTYLPQHSPDYEVGVLVADAEGPTQFVFTGNVGSTQGIDCILEAVGLLPETASFEVHFVGDGSYLETARRLASDKGLTGRVVFHGRHPAERIGEFLAMADACLLTLKSENLTGLTVPGKLQTYLAAGRPVIGAIDGPAREVIEEARCGLCVPSGDAAGLARAMREFMASRDKWTEWGSNARRHYETHYTFERFIITLEQMMADLMGPR